MNVTRLGMQKHNHTQTTLQLAPMVRRQEERDGTLRQIEFDMYGYYRYMVTGPLTVSIWDGPIHSFLSKYPSGNWRLVPRQHPWSIPI